jgi:mono/diheme cytochrome c family protein
VKLAAAIIVVGAQGCSSCDLERMIDQPRYTSYEACETCPTGTIMMQPPAGTVARGADLVHDPRTTGRDDQGFAAAIPVPVDRMTLVRGRDRFDIFCAACHGRLGNGQSQVAENMTQRKPPALIAPPYTTYRPGRMFVAITNGFGLMRSYAQELPVADRWAVVAYVQALQLSQAVPLDQLPDDTRKEAERWLR